MLRGGWEWIIIRSMYVCMHACLDSQIIRAMYACMHVRMLCMYMHASKASERISLKHSLNSEGNEIENIELN